MFRVKNKNTVFTDVVMVFLLLTLNIFTPFSSVSIIFKQVKVNILPSLKCNMKYLWNQQY